MITDLSFLGTVAVFVALYYAEPEARVWIGLCVACACFLAIVVVASVRYLDGTKR